jgi:hypothetical protein
MSQLIYTARHTSETGAYQSFDILESAPKEIHLLVDDFPLVNGNVLQYLARDNWGAVIIARRIPGAEGGIRGSTQRYVFAFPKSQAVILLKDPMRVFRLADYALMKGPALEKTMDRWPEDVMAGNIRSPRWTSTMSDAYAAILCRLTKKKPVCFVTQQDKLSREELCRVLQTLPPDQRADVSFSCGYSISGSHGEFMSIVLRGTGDSGFDIPAGTTALYDNWLTNKEQVSRLFDLKTLPETLPTEDPQALREALLPVQKTESQKKRNRHRERSDKSGRLDLRRTLHALAPFIRAVILLLAVGLFLGVGNICHNVGGGVYITLRLSANDLIRMAAVFAAGVCVGSIHKGGRRK